MDDKCADVAQLIRDREKELRDYLNCLGRERIVIKGVPDIVVRALNRVIQWISPDDPVRTKNLEKVAGYLHEIPPYLDTCDTKCGSGLRTASLCSLLEQIRCPAEISSSNAWELADLLEVELIRLGDDPYLYALLKAKLEIYGTDVHRDEYSPYEYLTKLHNSYHDGKFDDYHSRLETRRFLEHLQHNTISEYRRDRAKAQLRGIYLGRMALILTVLLFFFGYFYLKVEPLTFTAEPLSFTVGQLNFAANQANFTAEPLNSTTGQLNFTAVHLNFTVNQSNFTVNQSNLTANQLTRNLLLLVAFAGAIGSVLSRAYRLGKQPLHAETGIKTEEPPLGIRALISEWKVFVAQPVIGAAAALISYLVFSSGMIGGVKELSPALYGLIAFLAGFSEPFFTDIIDKVGGMAGGSKL